MTIPTVERIIANSDALKAGWAHEADIRKQRAFETESMLASYWQRQKWTRQALRWQDCEHRADGSI